MMDGQNDQQQQCGSTAIGSNSIVAEQGGSEKRSEQDEPKISKRQMKKQKRLEQFLADRKERRKQEKERQRQKRRAKVAAGVTTKKTVLYAMNESKCRIRVAVDMAFEKLMDGRTLRKAISQLAHCYSANRRSPNPLQFYVVNVDGKAREHFDTIPGYRNWDAHLMAQPLTSLWCTEEIVYLTADSENLLETLDEQKVYVIGGLLDHNHHKGICLEKAKEHGFGHARLPIDSFFRLSGRKVLTINHVFEILVHFAQNPDWERAFLSVIPKRRGIERKEGECAGRQAIEESGDGGEVVDGENSSLIESSSSHIIEDS